MYDVVKLVCVDVYGRHILDLGIVVPVNDDAWPTYPFKWFINKIQRRWTHQNHLRILRTGFGCHVVRLRLFL